MPTPLAKSTAGPVGVADIFLSVNGKKQGQIKGECRAAGHVDEIDALSWQWGMSSPSAVGTTQATRRRVHEELVITKHLDAASTRLMNALATNEELKSVLLSLRKAGSDKDDFFKISLEQGRVSSLHVQSDEQGGLHEVVKFSYQKIEVTYHAQLAAGGVGGAQVFQDELSNPT
jgi:type VI secretion system secreted protein Hcp